MKNMKRTVAGIAAVSLALSMFTTTLGVAAYAEDDAALVAALTTTPVTTTVDTSQVARKTTTIDVTVPDYQMVATPTYQWSGTYTTHANIPSVVFDRPEDSEFTGATITVKGVDGTTLTYKFDAVDPDSEYYDSNIATVGKTTVTVNLDWAKLGGKLSVISSVYDNARAGKATDTLFGETKLDTPAITSIVVQPTFTVHGARTWKKDEVTAFTNTVKAVRATLNGVHTYTTKTEQEDGTKYTNILVKGSGASDISAAKAFVNDAANFKTEIAASVKRTEEAFPLDPTKTAEEVWDDFAASIGTGSAAVAAKFDKAAYDTLHAVLTVSETKAYDNEVVGVQVAPINDATKAYLPKGIDFDFDENDITAPATKLTGADKDVKVFFGVNATAGATADADKANFYISFVDDNGDIIAYTKDNVVIKDIGTTIVLDGVAANTTIVASTNTKTTKTAVGETFTLNVTPADLKAALHTLNGGDGGVAATAVWTDADILKKIGTYTGTAPKLNVNATNKVPTGIDYTISADNISAVNKGYGLKTDTNAVIAFKPIVDTVANKVKFNVAIIQKGTGIMADKELTFKSDNLTIAGLTNGELVLNGTGEAAGAALRLTIDDATALKEALVKDGLTPWSTADDAANYVTLGNYTAGKAAVEPAVADVTTALAAAGYAKPTKATYSYKTAETKARTLAIPYYTKGDTAFNSKADFITTYNAVADCYANLTTVKDAALQGDALDMTKYGPLSNFGPTANLYSAGKSECTDKAEYVGPDAIGPTNFSGATTTSVKDNRVFGEYDAVKGTWVPVWTNLTYWEDYYNNMYNRGDSTSFYTPGVLAEINDIIGTNKGAIVSIHVDPEGFEDDGRSTDAKRWFELNGRCVLRVNGASSSIYANLVAYDASTSTFSFNWDELTQNRYNDSTIQVHTLEIMTSDKLEVDSISISIPDQKAYNELMNPKPVEPEKDEEKDEVVDVDKDKDTVIEIEDGDKTDSDNVDIEAPDDEELPPEDLQEEPVETEKEDEDTDKDVVVTSSKDVVNDIPDDLGDETVTQKPVVDVQPDETVPVKDNTPTTGEPIALGVVPMVLGAVAAIIKKKLN